MKVLITGAKGFVGEYIYNNISLKHEVFTLGRKNSDYSIDLSDAVPSFNRSFDLVIHAAGKAHVVPKTLESSEEFFKVNLNGTQNLLDGIDNTSSYPKFFVFISSVAVYGLINGKNVNESSSLNALDPYGKSKILAEQLVLDWCQRNDVICTILRLPLVAGKKPPGNLLSMINGIRKGYYFNVGIGDVKKSIVLAEDVSNIILIAAKVGGVYNLTDGFHPSMADLAKVISTQLNKNNPKSIPIWLAKIIAKFGDIFGELVPLNSNKLLKITSELTFDDSEARTKLGWRPRPVLKHFLIN